MNNRNRTSITLFCFIRQFAGLLLVTNENIVEFANQAMCDLFDIEESPDSLRGLTTAEMIEKIQDVYAQPAENISRIREIVASNKPVRAVETSVRVGRTYLADYIPIVISGKSYGHLWHLTDITERKRAEQERENLRVQLLQSQKMQAIGTLVTGIADVFSDMLTDILNYSSMLLTDMDEGQSGYAELKNIIKTSRDAAELVKRIRMFSRKADLNPVPMDLSHQIDKVKKLLSRALPKMIDMEIRLPKGPVIINADPNQMAQVVMNLAINAGEAMPRGGRLTIQTETIVLDDEYCRLHTGVKPGQYAMLTVSDTGRGIDKGLIEQIFDPFFSTKVGDSEKGTGLGLSVVQGIVEQHGGQKTVESEVGKGTIFIIYLPTVVPWNM